MEKDKQQDRPPLLDRHGYRIIPIHITPENLRKALDKIIKLAEKYEQSNEQQQSNK
jgi:hypothetical protein